jgi:hypothetical protein
VLLYVRAFVIEQRTARPGDPESQRWDIELGTELSGLPQVTGTIVLFFPDFHALSIIPVALIGKSQIDSTTARGVKCAERTQWRQAGPSGRRIEPNDRNLGIALTEGKRVIVRSSAGRVIWSVIQDRGSGESKSRRSAGAQVG